MRKLVNTRTSTKVVKAKETLEEIIPRYCTNKSTMDQTKKLVDADNKLIKTLMQEQGLEKCQAGQFTASVNTTQRTSLNEDKVLAKIKELDRPDLIKTKEYVDMDLLEKAMYNQEIDPQLLNDCMTVKEVTTLRVTENKE